MSFKKFWANQALTSHRQSNRGQGAVAVLRDWHVNLAVVGIKMIGHAMSLTNLSKWEEIYCKKDRSQDRSLGDPTMEVG